MESGEKINVYNDPDAGISMACAHTVRICLTKIKCVY